MFIEDAVQEFIFECELKKLTWKTIRGYKNNLEYLTNYLQQEHCIEMIEDIKTVHLKSFFMYQTKSGKKESYMNSSLKIFRVFFKYHHEEGNITSNPALKVSWMKEPKTIIKTFQDHEVKAMLKAYSGYDFISIRNRAIIATLLDTGIRCYELCTLQTNYIKDEYIVILGKGKKERQVGKSPYLAKILMKYERAKKHYFEYKNIDDTYFLSRTGRPLTNSAIERIVKLAGEQANISEEIRCSPHTCRHYFAQAQLKNGMDVYSLSRILGHDNIRITQRYLQGLQDNDAITKSVKNSVLMNLR